MTRTIGFCLDGCNETSILPTAFCLLNCFLISISSSQWAVMTCPRSPNFSTNVSSLFPSPTLVEYRPCDRFGPTSIHTVFVVLYTMSWGPTYARHTSNSGLRAVPWVQSNTISSAQLSEFNQAPPTLLHNTLYTCCLEVMVLVICITAYTLYSNGDNCKPYLIAFEQRNVTPQYRKLLLAVH